MAQTQSSIATSIISIPMETSSLTLSSVLYHMKVFSCSSDEYSSGYLHVKYCSLERSEVLKEKKSTFGARGSAPYPLKKELEVGGKEDWYSSRIGQAFRDKASGIRQERGTLLSLCQYPYFVLLGIRGHQHLRCTGLRPIPL